MDFVRVFKPGSVDEEELLCLLEELLKEPIASTSESQAQNCENRET
jgi:hypothetical protein